MYERRGVLQDLTAARLTLATVQATYMDFPYLGQATTNIIQSDPLIGVSIGGIMNNPQILTNKDILAVGAMQVRQQNSQCARILGINPASRTTCVKPDGTVSLLLGMTSGIHGAYAKRYLRSVEANIEEPNLKAYEEANPKAVQPNHLQACYGQEDLLPHRRKRRHTSAQRTQWHQAPRVRQARPAELGHPRHERHGVAHQE